MNFKVPWPVATRWGSELDAASIHYKIFDHYPNLLKRLESANKANNYWPYHYNDIHRKIIPVYKGDRLDNGTILNFDVVLYHRPILPSFTQQYLVTITCEIH